MSKLMLGDGIGAKTDIGNSEPICPYCSGKLEKMPGRKAKCPHCGEYISVRTSPITGSRILVREDQLQIVEEAWAVKNGTHDEYIKNKEREERRKGHLEQQNNKILKEREADLNWSFLNSELGYYATNSDWAGYRNTRLEMANQLLKERKYTNALFSYLEVAYRDLASADNTISGGVFEAIVKIKRSTKMSTPQIKEVWDKYVTRVTLPMPHEDAWKEISELIKICEK